MLDLPQLCEAQKAGDKLFASLDENEAFILASCCDVFTNDVIKMGLQHQATSKDLIRNGILIGITLGIQLTIRNSQVEKR